jgi:hypothetical protein
VHDWLYIFVPGFCDWPNKPSTELERARVLLRALAYCFDVTILYHSQPGVCVSPGMLARGTLETMRVVQARPGDKDFTKEIRDQALEWLYQGQFVPVELPVSDQRKWSRWQKIGAGLVLVAAVAAAAYHKDYLTEKWSDWSAYIGTTMTGWWSRLLGWFKPEPNPEQQKTKEQQAKPKAEQQSKTDKEQRVGQMITDMLESQAKWEAEGEQVEAQISSELKLADGAEAEDKEMLNAWTLESQNPDTDRSQYGRLQETRQKRVSHLSAAVAKLQSAVQADSHRLNVLNHFMADAVSYATAEQKTEIDKLLKRVQMVLKRRDEMLGTVTRDLDWASKALERILNQIKAYNQNLGAQTHTRAAPNTTLISDPLLKNVQVEKINASRMVNETSFTKLKVDLTRDTLADVESTTQESNSLFQRILKLWPWGG